MLFFLFDVKLEDLIIIDVHVLRCSARKTALNW